AIILSAHEARVLGALIEKEATTPEYYPLSVNALANACNQKNNREPVMQLDETDIRRALNRLQDHQLVAAVRDSRVAKYEHRLQEVFNFTRGETAVLCVLLLRGPQTPGEIRSRTERIHHFEELDDVLAVLEKLAQREPPLVAALPRQPGSREIRYAHLLSGEPVVTPQPIAATPQPTAPTAQYIAATEDSTPSASISSDHERLLGLEAEVATLRQEVAELKAQLAALTIARS
ncbi:MAG: YceH family protein, partial [Acidobacteriaceae bacterium]